MNEIWIEAKSYYNNPGIRKICHDVKQTEIKELRKNAIQIMADELISRKVVEPGDVLIPAPQHTGNAEYTKRIAEIISRENGAVTADILKCVPHSSLYEQKKKGKRPDLRLYLSDAIPKAEHYFFIDNVISTGTTFREADRLFDGKLKPLVFAVDETQENALSENGLFMKKSVMKKLKEMEKVIRPKSTDNVKEAER